ncbi:WS/DGAT domain-containing protein [Lacrimispora sp.]|uniref:WS/DGAT domain-containing protein n=1 Tax=Lacrimispora sp. TaxID=2719234 RepID=UPI0032E3E299
MSHQIQLEMPVNGQDKANYIGHLWNKNGQIQMVLSFAERLDFECLKRAVRLTIDAEPILGCEFVINDNKPIWRRYKDLDRIAWCKLIETEEPDDMLHIILCKPFEVEKYQLEVYLLRSAKNDLLCIKINHSCSDGGGAKDYLHLLKETYTQLTKDANYYPKINHNLNRSTRQIFQNLGVINPATLINPHLAELKPTWAFPYRKSDVKNFNYLILHLTSSETNQLFLYAKEKKVTINDLILSAYYRALFTIIDPAFDQPMEICVTMDLRSYLEGGRAAICNLSGVLNHRIFRKKENSEATLSRVADGMKELKEDKPGLHSAALIEMLSGMDFKAATASIKNAWDESVHSGKSTINLSNFGIISSEPLYFGEIPAEAAYMVTPVFKAPSFMLGASTYQSKLTFTVGFCEPEVREEDVKQFLSDLKKELHSYYPTTGDPCLLFRN